MVDSMDMRSSLCWIKIEELLFKDMRMTGDFLDMEAKSVEYQSKICCMVFCI
jgi:hypothetical protein